MGLIKAKRRWVKFLLGLLFSLLVIGWAITSLDWVNVWQSLRTAHYGWVLIAVLLNFMAFVTRAFRWGVFLQSHAEKRSIPFRAYFDALIIGQAANYISPVPRAGDVIRAYLLGEATQLNKVLAFGTVALEKLWDILMLLLFTAAVGWFFPLPDWLVGPVRLTLIVAVMSTSVTGLLLWRQTEMLDWFSRLIEHWLPRFHQRLLSIIQNGLNSLASIRELPAVLASGGWSVVVWVIGGLLNYAVFIALALPVPFVAAFLLLVVLQVGVALPSLPGRIGVFEGLCVAVLALFEVPFEVAFSYGLILHLVVFLPPIVLAMILGFRLKLQPAQMVQFDHD